MNNENKNKKERPIIRFSRTRIMSEKMKDTKETQGAPQRRHFKCFVDKKYRK